MAEVSKICFKEKLEAINCSFSNITSIICCFLRKVISQSKQIVIPDLSMKWLYFTSSMLIVVSFPKLVVTVFNFTLFK